MKRIVLRTIVFALIAVGFTFLAQADDGEGCEIGIAEECARIIETRQLFGKPINDANLAVTYFNRGNARLRKGEFDGAIDDYNMAIKLKPKYAKAYANRGSCWYNKGRYGSAISDYNAAINLDPKDPISLNNRGKALLAAGKWKKAIPDFKRASNLLPQNAQIKHGLGEAYFISGDTSSALKNWESACRVASNNAMIEWQKTLLRLGLYDGELSGTCNSAVITAFQSCAEIKCQFY